jgi:copper chaperone
MTNTILKVDGMTCHACIRHVNAALRDVDGVSNVDVQLRDGTVTVTHAGVEATALVEAVREAGYDAQAA